MDLDNGTPTCSSEPEPDPSLLNGDPAYRLAKAVRDDLLAQKDFLQAQIEAGELVVETLHRKAEQVALVVQEAQAQLEMVVETFDAWGLQFPDGIVDSRIARIEAIRAERIELLGEEGGDMLWDVGEGGDFEDRD